MPHRRPILRGSLACGVFLVTMFPIVLVLRQAGVIGAEFSPIGLLWMVGGHIGPFLLALVTYHCLTSPSAWMDGVTRCGGCGETLRDLDEPRCPRCQRAI